MAPPERPTASSPDSGLYDPAADLSQVVESYRQNGDLGDLFDRLRALAGRASAPLLKRASEPYRDMPEVVIPLFERIVNDLPDDAQSMVVLANAYWLTGRGPDAVNRLVSRAKEVDPANRGAWHLWSLAEPDLRKRVDRWFEVSQRFPADQLARAALADNAVSLAGEQDDPVALQLAIDTYRGLLAEATQPTQRRALQEAIDQLTRSRGD